MHELLEKVLTELRSAWRFRWWGAAAAWAAFLAGTWWTASQPDVYEASAQVYIDTSSVLRPILENQIVPPDIGTQLAYVREALFGRETLERVARATDLDASAVTPAQREAVLNRLRSAIALDSSGGSRGSIDNVYSLGYRHRDRDTAVAVVSTLLNILVEDTLGANRAGSETAERFLEERIKEYEARLARAEQARADFKRENADRLPGAEGGYFERIRREREELEEVEKSLRLAESRREQLRQQMESESPVMTTSGLEPEPPPESLDGRIRSYRRELDRLLLTYTDKHPDVIAVREALSRLEDQRAEQLRALGFTDEDVQLSSLASNPIYQSLQIAMSEVDLEIASLKADIAERQEKLSELQALVDEVPAVEAELARLNRDYDIIYDQYLALVKSRETQDLSRKATDTERIEFRVINPPLASFQPVAPDRLRLLAVTFIGSLMGGAGLCWLLAQLRPVFTTTSVLRQVSGLPVLGAVTQAWESRYRIRWRLEVMTFASVIAALVLVFAMTAAIEVVGPGIRLS